MLTLRDIARHVRSKNAGPFWVSIDIFLDSDLAFQRVKNSPWLNKVALSQIFKIETPSVNIFPIESQRVIKISFPRRVPQGSIADRDLHSGQLFVQLLKQVV